MLFIKVYFFLLPTFLYTLKRFFNFIYSSARFCQEIFDKGFKNGFVVAFQYAVKFMSSYLHVPFLDTCERYGLCPPDSNINKKPFLELESDDLIIFWKKTLLSAENDLLEALYVRIYEGLFTLEKKFWNELRNSIKTKQKKI